MNRLICRYMNCQVIHFFINNAVTCDKEKEYEKTNRVSLSCHQDIVDISCLTGLERSIVTRSPTTSNENSTNITPTKNHLLFGSLMRSFTRRVQNQNNRSYWEFPKSKHPVKKILIQQEFRICWYIIVCKRKGEFVGSNLTVR